MQYIFNRTKFNLYPTYCDTYNKTINIGNIFISSFYEFIKVTTTHIKQVAQIRSESGTKLGWTNMLG